MTMTRSDLFAFGALLKTFRTRCHLTQQQLATALGMHRHAIGRWEQGDYLPESKTLVMELARLLKLDDYETRQLLEASLTALAPHWSVPLPRNPFFMGREEVLEALQTHLGIEQAVVLCQSSVLHGLGGVGKTQIALEYAYRHALEYSAVFWIAAETDEQIVVSLLRIAEVLQLAEREDRDQQHIVTALHRWLSTHGKWLLIWDNVEDFELLQRFLPATRSGVMLLTTRHQAMGTLGRGLDLLPMEQEEGVLFLLLRAKVLEPGASREQMYQLATRVPVRYRAASELVTVLGGLPLALDQAGAYLEETQCGLPAYLDLFRTRRDALLQRRGEDIQDHPASVSTTFILAVTEIAQHHPAIGDLLRVCALLQPDAIPEEIFRQGGEHLGTTLEIAGRNPLEWDRVVGIACAYSLLSRRSEEQVLSLHRLVQAVLLDTMTETEQEQWNRRVLEALDVVFPEVQATTDHITWKQSERLLPHVLSCLHRVDAAREDLVLASLACKAAQYLNERGQYTEAVLLYQRALHIQEQALGPEHALVASSLDGLANLYWHQGKYAQAEALGERALRIREQTLGSTHPDIATSLNTLGGLYRSRGKYAQAESVCERALHIREQVLGPMHPKVATSLNNLADLCMQQGKYAQAEALGERALHICEQTLGPVHPYTAARLETLATLFMVQERYEQAQTLYERALHIYEQTLGPVYSDMAAILNNLAYIHTQQGHGQQAEQLYQRALHIQKETLGMEHPEGAGILTRLASLYVMQEKYEQAEELYLQALQIWEQILGPEHPHTALTLHDLAILRHIQGNLSEAISLAKRALHIRSQSLGDSHPKTVATQVLYTQLLQEQASAQKEAIDLSSSANAPLQPFFDACCELHPRAWCRSSDLWRAYTQWTEERQERYPFSRRAFITQLKAHGCRADRTTAARIWRGIAVVQQDI